MFVKMSLAKNLHHNENGYCKTNKIAKYTRGCASDIIVMILLFLLVYFISYGVTIFSTSMTLMSKYDDIFLDGHHLLYYGFCTTFRMIIAMIASIIFSIMYATLAAKLPVFGNGVLIPILDVLQSIPVFGYLSFTVTTFMALCPDTVLGVELSAIFAIFTAQAWNITFSFYQSLTTIPNDILEVAATFRLTKWQKFWRLELPYALHGLFWNVSVSMAGSWFFIVASEAIAVGSNTFTLPGVGSYIAVALQQQDTQAIWLAVLMICTIIFLYSQIIINPLLVWADKFKYEFTKQSDTCSQWLLIVFSQSFIADRICNIFEGLTKRFLRFPSPCCEGPLYMKRKNHSLLYNIFRIALYSGLTIITYKTLRYIHENYQDQISYADIKEVLFLTIITFVRVSVMLMLASLIFVPLGIVIGLNKKLSTTIQPIAQFLAAFPANIFFPSVVLTIHAYRANPDIFLSPLIIVGAMWYILFNVIAGMLKLPNELKEACQVFKITGIRKWRKVLIPSIMPFYVTGAITAAGGAWNASVIAEAVSWGNEKISAHGVGNYIASKTVEGDYPHIMLGIAAMCTVVVSMNKFFWRPIYDKVAESYRE